MSFTFITKEEQDRLVKQQMDRLFAPKDLGTLTTMARTFGPQSMDIPAIRGIVAPTPIRKPTLILRPTQELRPLL